MVLYMTGICFEDCFYCPLSEEKKGKDVMFANERRLTTENPYPGMLEEARNQRALGTGITGGDPLMFPDRLLRTIRVLKEEFGQAHHIHLYTASPVDPEMARSLADSGLDEIRFHPPLISWSGFGKLPDGGDAANRSFHRSILSCIDAKIRTGIEVPAIPDPGGRGWEVALEELVDYAMRTGLSFVNLNELEASHTNAGSFGRIGYDLVGDSMAVVGSAELAERMIGEMRSRYPGSKTVLHLCTSVYKDSVQLRQRLIRTGKNVLKPYEVLTDDGTLLRGVVPTQDPEGLSRRLHEEYDVPFDLMETSDTKLFLAPWVLMEISGDLGLPCHISECYPTFDALEVERTPL